MKTVLALVFLLLANHIHANEALPELIIKKIQKNVYLHESFQHVEGFGLVSSNGLIVIHQNKAFIVDTPWSEPDTQALVNWIEKQNYQLSGSLSTHSHSDRTAGIAFLNARSVPTYAHSLTNNILKNENKEPAKISFSGSEFALTDHAIEIFYPGAGHSIDNIVVWLPEPKILFGGCLVKSLQSKGLGYTGSADIKAWPHSIEKVLTKYPMAKLVVPGHGKAGDLKLLDHTKRLTKITPNKPKAKASH